MWVSAVGANGGGAFRALAQVACVNGIGGDYGGSLRCRRLALEASNFVAVLATASYSALEACMFSAVLATAWYSTLARPAC